MHKNKKLSDDELLRKFYSTKDKSWLGLLLERYTLLLLGVAMKYLKDKDLAADAVQHTFMIALTKMPKEEVENIKGWLYIVIRNHCLQSIKNSQFYSEEVSFNSIAYQPTDENEFYAKEYTIEQVNMALEELGEEQRVCLRLFYYEKKSYQEIVDSLGYTFMQVKSYIQNGKRNLKNILSKKLDVK